MSNVVSMATATAAAAARLCRSAGLRSHPFSLRPKLSLNFSTSATIAAARLFRSAALASPPPSFRPKLSLNFATSATIAAGGKLPDSTLSYFDAAGELHTITTSDLTSGKKVILFAVPGAFTPTCSQKHLPSFVEKAGELRAKGVDTIACVSVNDAFVMRAWKEALKVGDEVLMLSDGNGEFTAALGVEVDLRDKPAKLGVRSRRYAMLVEDGVVNVLNLEEGGAFTFSGAGDILKSL